MKRCSIYAVIPLLVLLLCASVHARDMQTLEKSVPADADVKRVHLESDIGLAELSVKTHPGGDIFEAEIRYDAETFTVDVDYDKSGSAGDVYLTSDTRRRHLDYDSEDNRWRVSLSREYIWDIDLEIGFTESTMDFSGLPLERLALDVGASECRVVFDQPNPERLKKIAIDAGAGELKILGLGYANFEDLYFDGGAGDFLLNFEGFTEGFASARVDVGVGEVEIELPKGLPVRIRTDDGLFSSIKIRGIDLIEIDDDEYETENFDEAEYGLELALDIGIGEATIRWAGTGESVKILGSRVFDGGARTCLIMDGTGLDGCRRLPAIPELPALPALPAIPAAPMVLEIPELPELPELPDLPEIPVRAKVE